MKRKFVTQYNAEPAKPYQPSGLPGKVEKAGYIPAKKIIEQMVMAGMRLKAFREDNYDLGPEDDDEDLAIGDPTRSPGFDMADASQIAMELNRRKKAAKAEGSKALDPDKMAHRASSKEEKPAPVSEPAP